MSKGNYLSIVKAKLKLPRTVGGVVGGWWSEKTLRGSFLEKHIVKPNQISSMLKNEIVAK